MVVPLVLVPVVRVQQPKMKTTLFKTIITISIGLILLGGMFMVMHWPYGRPILIVGNISLGITYLFSVIMARERSVSDYFKLIFVLTSCLTFVIGLFFKSKYILNAISFGSLLSWLIFSIYENIFDVTDKKLGFKYVLSRIFFSVAATILILGLVLKILHWRGGSVTLAIGLTSACVWFAYDSFILKEN